MRPQLVGLSLGDSPERWNALGFSVEQRRCTLGGIALELGTPGEGITGWAVSGLDSELDGLPLTYVGTPAPETAHPNGATGIDHVVVVTPDFDRTAAALATAAMPLRRVIKRPDGGRMGFRRLGPAILELVEAAEAGPGPARFWGLTLVVSDLDALVERLGEHLGPVRDAVQPGRRIATLSRRAGLGEAMAFMSPTGAS